VCVSCSLRAAFEALGQQLAAESPSPRPTWVLRITPPTAGGAKQQQQQQWSLQVHSAAAARDQQQRLAALQVLSAFAGPPEMWSVVILYYSSIMIFYPLGQVAIEECEKRVAALEPGGGTGSGGHTMLAGGSSTRPGSGTPTSMAAGFFPPPTQWLRFGNCAGGY
jgi:hypothetical protein